MKTRKCWHRTKKPLPTEYLYLQLERTARSFFSDNPPSLSVALSFQREGGQERRAEQSLAKARVSGSVEAAHEVLFLSAKANSLWRQVGQHTYTHPHLGHRLVCPCLCLYADWQPSHQLRSQWAQRITMATSIVGQDVAALGSVWRLFWHPLSARVDYRVPTLKCPSRIGQWSPCEQSFFFFFVSFEKQTNIPSHRN